ncbi:MAG TPA: NADH-quinone oxidoreductase subunit NuoG [Steroidobacteraceae bacterium]|nr:NADH-quinone oxidoreductase subunit NuoG [Steroidobacteraceae bacterium]
MSDDLVNIEVDGVPMQARKGQMLIEVTDAHDVYVPRFCYHEKLSIAANCRMCLVEVEKAPKPLPACATPVMEGMKAYTKSPKAIAAQKATMEFLLINHPLDCPICDQGGECELQDLAMGFGRGISRYTERKRVVKDKNLGPLISTDMTRCIHCTRCVRFTSEIAGIQELGTVGRGEHTEIGTYIERSVDHELSANVIDLCPVGALNNKPFRYRARSWEMVQRPLVSPHDSLGTNLFAHVLRGRIMRIVPRPNESINETWIADRDRFGALGLDSPDRATVPLVREGGKWVEADWESALHLVAERLGRIARESNGSQIGALASSTSTAEELYLLNRLVRGLGSSNLDHRLQRTDFRDQENDPVFPWLGAPIADLERADAVLVVGSQLRKELPLLAHRVRKAALRGAKVSFVHPEREEYLFPVSAYFDIAAGEPIDTLAAILSAAAAEAGRAVPATVSALAGQVKVDEQHRRVARELLKGERAHVLLGVVAQRDPGFADLRAVAAAVAAVTGAELGYLADGGNTVGAHLAGVLPHRDAGGAAVDEPGLDAAAMLDARLKAYLLLGPIEPAEDIATANALEALRSAEFVVALSPFDSAREFANVILPVAAFAETSGTFVNLEGRWQSFAASAGGIDAARPAWKVLRVLGNLLAVPGFDYTSSEQVRDELARIAGETAGDNRLRSEHRPVRDRALISAPAIAMYRQDAYARRSGPLQQTRVAEHATTEGVVA